MKLLEKVFDTFRPHFEKGGKLAILAPAFETAEFVALAPILRAPSAPFVRDPVDLKRYMAMAIAALLPAFGASVYFFGFHVLLMVIVSYVVGGIVEVAFAVIRREEINEGFLVTGLIFPLTLPPTSPLWLVASGAFFGVFFGKEVFGGTGRNIFNPALVGRLFVTIAFPGIMTTAWLMPFADAVTSATPLSVFKTGGGIASLSAQLLGQGAGSMGETFRIGIIAGGLFLIWTKVANWRVPLAYIASAALFAWLGHATMPDKVAPALFQLLAGGLLFGAFFMATDPVTSPVTRQGKYIFGIGCGLLTVLIRTFSGYVEGVMFSIVIMNALTPLIDHIVLTLKYKPVAQ